MATQQQIDDKQTDLNNRADAIRTQVNLVAARATAIANKADEVENLKGGIMNTVLNERFEINNKLKWTNDVQRKIRFNEIAAGDVDYQNALTDFYTYTELKASAEAEAEFQRKQYRADELVMLWWANGSA